MGGPQAWMVERVAKTSSLQKKISCYEMSHKAYEHLGSRRNEFTFTFLILLPELIMKFLFLSAQFCTLVSQAVLN
jgi:hypothetical protein